MMMRDEVFYFIMLGMFVERADNIVRLLDVKFLAATEYTGDTLAHVEEFYFWAAILRSVLAFENYGKVYCNVIMPECVAELLILRWQNPCSLAACLDQVVDLLHKVRNSQSGVIELEARAILSELRDLEIEEIFE